MRQSLVELHAEEQQLPRTWQDDVIGSQMGLETNFVHSFDDALCIEHHLLLILYAGFEVLQGLSVAVVGSDEGSKDEAILKISVKVGDDLRVHWIDLTVVIGHPLQQDCFWNAVDIAFCHVGLNPCLGWRQARQVLEALWSDTVQIVDLENLVEEREPRLHREVRPHTLQRLWLLVLLLWIHLQELAMVREAQ